MITIEYICNAARGCDRFAYMMLDRMKSDCLYFLGYGNRCEKHLWSGNVRDHISNMKEIWNAFPAEGKPEWLSMEDICNFEADMLK